jgi:hypothetical protein
LFQRVANASSASADLLLSIHHDSVPDKFLEKWQFEGEEHIFSDRFKGHSIFISRSNGSYDASLQFARLLGNQLKARGLKYTPHYTEKFMGHRQRQLVDAEAGVYRYDQLIVLKNSRMPAALLSKRIHQTATRSWHWTGAASAHQLGGGRCRRRVLCRAQASGTDRASSRKQNHSCGGRPRRNDVHATASR